jgi:hypothetical protein
MKTGQNPSFRMLKIGIAGLRKYYESDQGCGLTIAFHGV